MSLKTALLEIFQPFVVTYRWLADHLTKVLGIIGTAIMSAFAGLMGIDPASVHDAAQTYLGQNAAAKIGFALFVLVILRGWYTGWKAKQKAQSLPPPDPSAVVKVLVMALILGTLASTCIAVAAAPPLELHR